MSTLSPQNLEQKDAATTLSTGTAVVLGGTGLVGSELVTQLLDGAKYQHVSLLLRRPSGILHPKIQEYIINFEDRASWADLVRGEVLFSCLGTTIRVAKTQEAQFRVDHDYQLWAAEAAVKNGILNYVLISSTGANQSSRIFYSRMKGQLEQAVRALRFESCTILRPSILDGNRSVHRSGERLALSLLRNMPAWALPSSARPSPVALVAKTAISSANRRAPRVRVIEATEIRDPLE